MSFMYTIIVCSIMVIITITLSFTLDSSKTISSNTTSNTITTEEENPSKECNERIEYTGKNSNIYTFKYPKCYTIEDEGNIGSTWISKDKSHKYEDHIVFSFYDGKTDPYRCKASEFDTETYLYRKEINIA